LALVVDAAGYATSISGQKTEVGERAILPKRGIRDSAVGAPTNPTIWPRLLLPKASAPVPLAGASDEIKQKFGGIQGLQCLMTTMAPFAKR
jgi:hypothetical protein